ncbi:uncharacterized protein LOC125659545 isoform X2 [Ostrea edulis]|uniref:uncharacterized protein LOC125659545 isoform X2 n=1 Tax=Ostrea edulis TaxID=37623 RepID=UPI0024AF103B|nr:uncharacterized protein LOC125659545 isoform X2 [Ostrea edulis]
MELRWKYILVFVLFLIEDECVSLHLDDLQKEYGEWRLQRSPEYSTTFGFYRYNDQVEKFAYSGLAEEYNKCLDLLVRLQGIDYNQLTAKEKTDYDIFNDTLSTIIRGYDWRNYNTLNPINFLEGPQTIVSYLPTRTPFDTVGDYENYIKRLELYPNQIEEMIERFNISIEKGHTYHIVSVNRIPGQIDYILKGVNDTNFPLYQPFLDKLTNLKTIAEPTKTDMRNRAKTAVGAIVQKYRDLKAYLENVYFQHTRSGFGVSSWDRGLEFYKECLRWHLSLDMSPEEVHNKGLQEVERISSEMKKVMMKLNHQGSVKEFFDKVKTDPKFYFQTGDEIIQWYKNAIKNDIQPKLSSYFRDLPNLPVNVEPSPTDGVGGRYIPGPSDGSRPGIFQVNVHRPNQSVTIDFMALLIHETNPGHHLQISIASTVKIPSFRKNAVGHLFTVPFEAPFFTAFVEGWALYTEALGEEMELYKTDYDMMGRYGSEIFRACRLVVDTGLHYFNWTKEQAVEYMLNYTAYSEAFIRTEVDRYLTLPGQACAYKIGELKIMELRMKAQEELGSKFDIKDFHSVVLKDGALPLNILEKNVNQWITETKSKHTETKKPCTSAGTTRDAGFKLILIISIIVLFLK